MDFSNINKCVICSVPAPNSLYMKSLMSLVYHSVDAVKMWFGKENYVRAWIDDKKQMQ